MKEIYRNFLLSLNEDENENINQENYQKLINLFDQLKNSKSIVNINQNNDYKAEDFETSNLVLDQKLAEDPSLENPFLINSNLNLNNRMNGFNSLFLSSDNSEQQQKQSSNMMDFNTDTKLDFIGGLTIWQLTAILLAFLMFITLSVFLIKKMNKVIYSITQGSVRSSSVRSSYSTESTNHLLAKNFTLKANDKVLRPDFV